MKAALLAIVLLGLCATAFADDEEYGMVDESAARFLFFNSSGTASTLTLLGALILLGVIGYLIYAQGLLVGAGATGYEKNDFYNQYGAYEGQYDYSQQAQYRSNYAYDFNGLNIVSWISMLQELYEKFDYRDLDCQKRLICEVMKEPEYYGTLARKFKNGFQYAKYLEFLNLPDDMRELLDEYMDANSRSQNQKECKEFFECPFSVKDTMSRALPENHL